MVCPNCKKMLAYDAQRCNYCGTLISNNLSRTAGGGFQYMVDIDSANISSPNGRIACANCGMINYSNSAYCCSCQKNFVPISENRVESNGGTMWTIMIVVSAICICIAYALFMSVGDFMSDYEIPLVLGSMALGFLGVVGLIISLICKTSISSKKRRQESYIRGKILEYVMYEYSKSLSYYNIDLNMYYQPLFDYENQKNIYIASHSIVLLSPEASLLNECGLGRFFTFNIDNIGVVLIQKNYIDFYYKEGDIQYTSKVSGGGGGGSSIAGALIGGAVAGSTGAIIGSRRSVREITTTVEEHDSRYTVIRYRENGNLNCVRELKFRGFDVYDVLLMAMPDKDMVFLQTSRMNQNYSKGYNSNNTSASSAKSKLETLKEMYDEKLISEAEYNEKRRQIINSNL